MFWAEILKISEFLSENFQFLVEKNSHIFEQACFRNDITRWAWFCLRCVVRHQAVAPNAAFEKLYVDVRTSLFTTFWSSHYIGFMVAFEEFISSFRCILCGWLGVAKMSCNSRHWGVQLIFAYSWGMRGIFFTSSVSSISFISLFLPCRVLSSPLPSLLCLFSLSLGDDTKWPRRVDVSLNPTQSINQCNLWNHKLSKNTDQPYLFNCINISRVPQKIFEHPT